MGAQRAFSKTLLTFAAIAICYSVAHIVALYMRMEPEFVVRFTCFILMLCALRYRFDSGKIMRREAVSLALFSTLFGGILGFHIVSDTGDMYAGLISSNYISDYTLLDTAGFLCITVLAYALGSALFQFIKHKQQKCALEGADASLKGQKVREVNVSRLPFKHIVFAAGALFLLWMPYLLLYWPGLIFGDSISSLKQALDIASLNNHHPVAYTMLVKVCLTVANTLGFGNTAGCVLYNVIQMLFMGACFAFLVVWIKARCSLKATYAFALLVFSV